MRNKWLILAALSIPLALSAQSDTTRIFRSAISPGMTEIHERSFEMEDTPELQKTPDSLTRVQTTTIYHYTDTLTLLIASQDSVAKQREEVTYADSTSCKGHYIEAYVGLGYGSLGYVLANPYSSANGSFSGLLQIQYAYFFHENWGVGAGLWFTNYTSHAHLRGNYLWKDQTDTDLEQHYDHHSTVNRWNERQTIHNIGVPISLQFQYKKEDWKARILADLGIAPAFSVMKKYKVLQGEVAHEGYYPAWHLWLNDMHEFGVKNYAYQGKLDVRPQVALFMDLGALLPLTDQIDLFLGGHFNIALNDANKSTKHPLGWKDDTFTFMDEYTGAYSLDMAGKSHPWEVGVKVGIHWHHIDAPKHKTIDYFDYFTRTDTTVQLIARNDTSIVSRVDTLTRAHIKKAAEEVEKFNKIYFALASHQLTNKAKAYLSSIVDVLNKVPDAKVSIDGHASEEGDKTFNEILAYNRAKAVANYLISQGLDKDRVIVIGHGSLVPNEENVNHELPLDRRAEVKVVQKQSDIE